MVVKALVVAAPVIVGEVEVPQELNGASVDEIAIAVVPLIGFVVLTEPVAQVPSASVAHPTILPVVTLNCSILLTPLAFVLGTIVFQAPDVVLYPVTTLAIVAPVLSTTVTAKGLPVPAVLS